MPSRSSFRSACFGPSIAVVVEPLQREVKTLGLDSLYGNIMWRFQQLVRTRQSSRTKQVVTVKYIMSAGQQLLFPATTRRKALSCKSLSMLPCCRHESLLIQGRSFCSQRVIWGWRGHRVKHARLFKDSPFKWTAYRVVLFFFPCIIILGPVCGIISAIVTFGNFGSSASIAASHLREAAVYVSRYFHLRGLGPASSS